MNSALFDDIVEQRYIRHESGTINFFGMGMAKNTSSLSYDFLPWTALWVTRTRGAHAINKERKN